MKKLLLLTLAMIIGFLGFSQKRVQVSKDIRNIEKTAVHVNLTDEASNASVSPNPYVSNSKELVGENIIGTSWYDLWGNYWASNRIHLYPDGTMAAVWTQGFEPPAFDGRGTGYNYFDGTNWGDDPTVRIEDVRTGWPSYAPLGENGEIVVSHDYPTNLVLSTREQKGTGDWNQSVLFGPGGNGAAAWPRVVTSDEDNNTIHIIASSYNPYEGQENALLYYRSLDGGESWENEAEILDGTGEDFYTEIPNDNYGWADPNGGAIAFVVGGAWNDLFMMKSTDNGDSWEKTVIWEHPYPLFVWEETVTDTFFCADNSANITLDNNGNAHVVFGISRVGHFEVGTTYSYWAGWDGVGYWTEGMPTFTNNLDALSPDPLEYPLTEMVEDYNLVGWTQDVDGSGTIDLLPEIMTYNTLGLSTMPSVAVDDYGTVFLAYSSTTETYDNGEFNYKHIWVRQKEAAETWGAFTDLDENVIHQFDECIYPMVTQNIYPDNQSIYVFYQADYIPGLAAPTTPDHEYDENRMFVVDYNIGVGINENSGLVADFSVSQNTPNPANNSTSIIVETEKTGVINLSINNLLGQVVHQESVSNSSPIYTFDVNVSNLELGIYFYTIEIGNSSVTKKMLVN